MPSSNTSYSLVAPNNNAALFYDESEGSGSDYGEGNAGDAAWTTDEVVAFDGAGRAGDLEDEDLLDEMEREVAAYQQHRTAQADAKQKRKQQKQRMRPVPMSPGLKERYEASQRHKADIEAEKRAEEAAAREEEERRRERAVSGGGKSVDAGYRLYHDAVGQHRRKQDAIKAKEAADQDVSRVPECTFRPKITGAAQAMERQPLVERLAQPRNVEGHGNPKHDREERDLAGCTFRPQVSKGSERLAAKSDRTKAPAPERLHRESETRQLRQKLREKHVGEWQRDAAVGGRPTVSQDESNATVARMYEWHRQKQEFVDLLRDEVTKPPLSVHVDTAQVVARLTTPQFSAEAAQCESHLRENPGGSANTTGVFASNASVEPAPRINAVSEELARSRRGRSYLALFQQLDPHTVGTITLETVEVEARHIPELVQVLSALRGAGVHEKELVTLEAFGSILANYERRFGPQGWSAGGIVSSRRKASSEATKPTFQPNLEPCGPRPGTNVPLPIRTDGHVHERLYRQAAAKERVREALTHEASQQSSKVQRGKPTITKRGAQATGKALTQGAGSQPSSRVGSPQRGAASSSRRHRDPDGSLEDVLAEIDDALADGQWEETAAMRGRGEDDAAASERGQALGLPPKSPTLSRKGLRGDTSSAHLRDHDGSTADSSFNGTTPAATADESAVLQAHSDLSRLRKERQARLKAKQAAESPSQAANQEAPEQDERSRSPPFPGQPDSYNLPAQTLQELLYPVQAPTARVTARTARHGAPVHPDDLRQFGRAAMRQQLDKSPPRDTASEQRGRRSTSRR